MSREVNLNNSVLFYVVVVLISLLYIRSWPNESNDSTSNVGTVDSLRKNIEDLLEGNLVFSDENLPSDDSELSDTTPETKSVYDFIVVGAGSAGATVASRLSEIPNVTVLLIEAGGKEYPIMDIPLMAGYLQLSNQVNWKYQTESSNRYCLGMTDHKCNWPRGKVTGGSSVLNYMVATRCNKKDYDDWAIQTGDDSWSHERMLKYLMKIENYHVEHIDVNDEFHNKTGPLHISSFPTRDKLGDAFIEAGKQLGYPELHDNEEKPGFSYFQLTTHKGERWSTNRAYLRPAKDRKNLFFTRNSLVRKVLINDKTKLAYGVEFSKSNKVIEVRARKEVILSAGAINSPQILMLSGVGPAKHLQEMNIKLIKDSPVGENLMDHVAYGGLIFKVNDSSNYKDIHFSDPEDTAIEEYVKFRKGLLSYGAGFEALAYVNVDDPSPSNEHPNIEFIFGSVTGMKHPLWSKLLNIAENYRNEMNTEKFDHSAWTIWPMIMTPKSRGKLLLRSSNPYEKPMIYPNYFSDTDDVRVLIKGIRMVFKLSETEALKKYGSQLYQVPLPNCQHHEIDSDAYWECALRTYTITIYHHSGTCRMGPENSSSSVVDPQLKVCYRMIDRH